MSSLVPFSSEAQDVWPIRPHRQQATLSPDTDQPKSRKRSAVQQQRLVTGANGSTAYLEQQAVQAMRDSDAAADTLARFGQHTDRSRRLLHAMRRGLHTRKRWSCWQHVLVSKSQVTASSCSFGGARFDARRRKTPLCSRIGRLQ